MSDLISTDRDHMRRALVLAERGWGRVAPNPLVGAVLVRDGEVVGEGWHAEYGRAHAEVAALIAAGERARGATAYVTLEPCSHHGKTPPCTDALLKAGVARVVYAAADPDPQAGGGGAVLESAGVAALGGVESAAARDQNAIFFHRHSAAGASRPWIELKLAMSLDARVADAAGRSTWITGEEARAEVHRLRTGFDAIGVGIGTALADDPQLTVRGAIEPRVPPLRVIFDRTLRLPPASRLATSARENPVCLIAAPDPPSRARRALEALGVRVLSASTLEEALRLLRGEGVASLLVEGGGALASALLREEVVDRLSLFYAPILLGTLALSPFAGIADSSVADTPRWRHLRTGVFGADTLISLARAI